ncbi:hypothetical protein PUR57_00065, partial [Streptomyces sp. JV176]|nr:hypothetical protein [Streptomyces sp. JV176]
LSMAVSDNVADDTMCALTPPTVYAEMLGALGLGVIFERHTKNALTHTPVTHPTKPGRGVPHAHPTNQDV